MTKTEIIVRGLYHADAADLEITLLHQEHSCVLSEATSSSAESSDSGSTSTVVTRPAGVQFGVPEERRYMGGFGPNPGGCKQAQSFLCHARVNLPLASSMWPRKFSNIVL